jgi:hypothetical protein
VVDGLGDGSGFAEFCLAFVDFLLLFGDALGNGGERGAWECRSDKVATTDEMRQHYYKIIRTKMRVGG